MCLGDTYFSVAELYGTTQWDLSLLAEFMWYNSVDFFALADFLRVTQRSLFPQTESYGMSELTRDLPEG